ncbi:serine/threonine protein kinase [Amycolatopsis sp. NBC_01286]|uniref:serine/threonine protein kinase n=1 Tax=Amycolatopsis sp. NBC_01286 TaxID=2903560 RepID=UPI002E11A465|nr:protein kinase [Amycolatopsis sp. NBC_01286]
MTIDTPFDDLVLVGTGPVAEVYAGVEGDTAFALKIFPGPLDRPTRSALERELARLRSTSVLLPDIDALPDGRAVLRLPLCSQSLADLDPLDAADTTALGEALATALATIHTAGVVHGGLTPGNVLFRPDGEPVLTDAGLALRTAFGGETSALGFRAPETVRDAITDERTDLYGLGALLYYAATGRPPFPGDGSPDHVLRILHGFPAPIGRPDLPPGLENLVTGLLSPDPANRPIDAAYVAGRLAELAADQASTPGTPVTQTPGDTAAPRPGGGPLAGPGRSFAGDQPALGRSAAGEEPDFGRTPVGFGGEPGQVPARPTGDRGAHTGSFTDDRADSTHPTTGSGPERGQAPTGDHGAHTGSFNGDRFGSDYPTAGSGPEPGRAPGGDRGAHTGSFSGDRADSTQSTTGSGPERGRAPGGDRGELTRSFNGNQFEPDHSAAGSGPEPGRAPGGDRGALTGSFTGDRGDSVRSFAGDRDEPGRSLVAVSGPASRPRRSGRLGVLLGVPALVAVVVVVAVVLLRDDPAPLTPPPAPPAPSSAAASSASGPALVLDPPADGGSYVDLTWHATGTLEFAVIVAAEGEPARTRYADRNRTLRVPVDPGRKYCFLVQATDGTHTVESQPQPLRGATCGR